MTAIQHVRSDEYVHARTGALSATSLALRIHDHLLGVCPACATTWSQLGGEEERLRSMLAVAARVPRSEPHEGEASQPDSVPPEEIPNPQLGCYSPQAQRDAEALRRIRKVRHRARKETWELLQLSPAERELRIDRGYSRFRSRSTALFLIERCRERIHHDPVDAGHLASLVPRVLGDTTGAAEASWARELEALAAGWRATALRAAGDLAAADRAFALLRRTVATAPLESNAVLAQLHELEAELRLDQRRLPEAADLLELAGELYWSAAQPEGWAQNRLRLGELLGLLGRDGAAFQAFREAAAVSCGIGGTASASPGLLRAVAGQVLHLAHQGRDREAQAILEAHLDVFDDSDDVRAGPLLRRLRGRIALARQEHAAAESFLRSSHEGYRTVGCPREVALIDLDLAELYLGTGRTADIAALGSRLLRSGQELAVDEEVLEDLGEALASGTATGLDRNLRLRLRQALVLSAPTTSPRVGATVLDRTERASR